MDALTKQFLIEARELVARAADDLMTLERDPADASPIERLFRAIHTLKGSAGIVELPSLGRLMHAAEEVLELWREGRARPSAELIDWLLGGLDQTELWLEHFEASGELPSDADDRANSLIAQKGETRVRLESATPVETLAWVEGMLANSRSGADPVVAVDYEPRSRCFFDGDDPIDLLRRLPGLLALHIEPREPWPPLAALDPFACNLRIRAITKGPVADVRSMFRFVADQAWIGQVDAPEPQAAPDDALLAAILAEQERLIEIAADEGDPTGRLDSAARVMAGALRHAGDRDRALRVEAAGKEAVAMGDPRPLRTALHDQLSRGRTPDRPGAVGTVLRIDSARMDALADLVGEIVVARNALNFLIGQGEAGMQATDFLLRLRERGADIERLTTLLQQSVTGLRLLPLEPLFRRFPRLVRETARALGKKATLVNRGEETQVDKAIVDMLFEPLLHLVRNALDHGIEAPDERHARGKPMEGTISLAAFQRGERVMIEVADDGRGMDEDAIRRTAVARNFLSEEDAGALSGPETLQLVFRPGFSTVSHVSDLSGRGIGMDVVRTAVEAVGGRIELSSRPGQGTICRLDLPIGMSLTRILVVRVGAEKFGLPMDRAVEVLRLSRSAIHTVHGGQAFVLRGRTVPVTTLADLLGIPSEDVAEEVPIVAVSSGEGTVGIAVDDFEEQLDVALRPPEGLLAAMQSLLGTTLRGDGRVLLVLDLDTLLK